MKQVMTFSHVEVHQPSLAPCMQYWKIFLDLPDILLSFPLPLVISFAVIRELLFKLKNYTPWSASLGPGRWYTSGKVLVPEQILEEHHSQQMSIPTFPLPPPLSAFFHGAIPQSIEPLFHIYLHCSSLRHQPSMRYLVKSLGKIEVGWPSSISLVTLFRKSNRFNSQLLSDINLYWESPIRSLFFICCTNL